MQRAPRIAIFGLLGSGNLGNHGSLDAVLHYLREAHPDAEISCVCAGPEEFERQYGIPATAMTWYQAHGPGRSRLESLVLKGFGKVADLVRTPRILRRYDVVIVPGMGVLETTLQLHPWGWPYALFLMSLSARLDGAKTAFVSVGANVARERSIRWFYTWAARLASYRSYRDEYSRDAMRQMGLDTSRDEVYPDLAFALPTPEAPAPSDPSRRTVALGVMAYHGTNADRARSEEIYSEYVGKIVELARWLIDAGYRIRLVTGDPVDESVVTAVYDDLGRTRPDLVDSQLFFEPAESLGEVMEQLAGADLVIASRYHNVQAALRMSKPTISISYATKVDILMEGMRLAEFRQPIKSLDVPRLIEQLRALEARAARLEPEMHKKNAEYEELLNRQFTVLSATLFGADDMVHSDTTGE